MARKNEPLSSLTHLIGAALALIGTAVLVVLAALRSDTLHVTVFAVFGASLILLYLASTLYHFFSHGGKAKEVFKRIDHALIYVLIAGSYTPITLIALKGGWGWTLFGIVWGLAVLGVIAKSCAMRLKPWLSTALYIAIGWLAVIAYLPLRDSLPWPAFAWLFAGGICYTVGALFYSIDHLVPRTRWFGMHEIFHVFVMAGSFCHWWLMYKYVLAIA